jgi:hypothetical protein
MMKKFLTLLFISGLVTGCTSIASLDGRLTRIEENLIKVVLERIDSKLDPLISEFNKPNWFHKIKSWLCFW